MPPARAVLLVSTIAGIALTAWSMITVPPPLPLSILGTLLYFGVVLSGVFVLRLRMYADAVVKGPDEARGVVLTFDDGPDPEHTREVLDLLEARRATATFFVIGHKAEKHPDLVREIARRGHEVGVHGYAHDRLFALRGTRRVRADLNRAVAVLEGILGETPTLFRPPIGHTNPTIARVADELDFTTVGWSVGARDGIGRTRPDDVVKRVARGLHDGAIVLLHDASERGTHKPAGVTALARILDAIEAKNLRVTPLREWLPPEGPSESEAPEQSEKAS